LPARLDGNTRGVSRTEAPTERRSRGRQATFLHDLANAVQLAVVAVLVAQIDADDPSAAVRRRVHVALLRKPSLLLVSLLIPFPL